MPPFHLSMDQEGLLPQTCAAIPPLHGPGGLLPQTCAAVSSLHGPGGIAHSNVCHHSTPPWTRRDCSLKRVPPFHPSIDQQGLLTQTCAAIPPLHGPGGLLPQTCAAIPPLHGPGGIAPSNMCHHSIPPWTRRVAPSNMLRHPTPPLTRRVAPSNMCRHSTPPWTRRVAPSNMCRRFISPWTRRDCSLKHVTPSHPSIDQEGLLPQTCAAIPPLHGPGRIAPSNMCRHSIPPLTSKDCSLKHVAPFHSSMAQEGLLPQTCYAIPPLH